MSSIKSFIYILLLVAFFGCGKDFLDKKPNSSIVIPNTLEACEQLLEDEVLGISPELGEVSSDDYYLLPGAPTSQYQRTELNAHIWSKDIYEGATGIDSWRVPYQEVFYANTVIEQLDKMDALVKASLQWRNLYGWAHYVRSVAYFSLAQVFCLPYDNQSKSTDLGLPLKLSPSIDEIVNRSTVEETYKQVFNDMTTARNFVEQIGLPQNRNRPSKVAIFAQLSRMYLAINDFDNAEKFADSTLIIHRKLLNFNDLNLSARYTFSRPHDEMLFYNITLLAGMFLERLRPNTIVDSILYRSYDQDDLRKQIYFAINATGNVNIKAGMAGPIRNLFTGPTTGEMLLIKAECLTRRGQIQLAAKYLDELLEKRYVTGKYQKIVPPSGEILLSKILLERRKELIGRCIRWTDVRRLNKLGANITLHRRFETKDYELPPNDIRYALPIPPDEINFSNIKQNPR